VIAVGFPLLGVLAYVPWPAYQPFYAIPFLVGTSILIAFAWDGLSSRRSPIGVAGRASLAVLLLAALFDANTQANRAVAVQTVHRRLVTRLHTLAVDTVLVASDRRVTQEWQGLGRTLDRYARSVGDTIPSAIDAPCTGIETRPATKPQAIVFYNSLCPRSGTRDPIVEYYPRVDLGRLRVARDSVRVDVEIRATAGGT